MIAVMLILILFLSVFLYQRYMPVTGLRKWNIDELLYIQEDMVVVDTRDYILSHRDPKRDDACCIPLAYLKRFAAEIPDKEIVVVASSAVEKNLSIRALRNEGLHVKGYSLTACRQEECCA